MELVKDLTAEQFLFALRRFIARRGKPAQLILDNAPQFKLAKTAIDKAWKETVSNHELQSYTANQGIEWNFIVELAFDSGFSLAPADFFNLNPQSGVPLIEINNPHDPDYGKKSSADKLLELWGKGRRHLNSLWRVWKDDYLLSLRERGQTHVKGPRIQAAEEPRVGSVVLLKEDLLRGVWKIGKLQN